MNSQYLNSCQWTAKANVIAVTAGATTTVPIRLNQGVPLTVQMNDNNGLLAKTEKFPGEHLHVGVQNPDGHWTPMKISNPAPNIRQFSTLVPADIDLKLIVKSDVFQLADASGSKVDTKTPSSYVPVKVSSVAAAAAVNVGGAPVSTAQFSVIGLQ